MADIITISLPGVGTFEASGLTYGVGKGSTSGSFITEWGAHTPALNQAVQNGRTIAEAVFTFHKTAGKGEEEDYFKLIYKQLKLTKLTHSSGRPLGEGSAKHSSSYDTRELTEVFFTYLQVIEQPISRSRPAAVWTAK